jgi:hypothetical protein
MQLTPFKPETKKPFNYEASTESFRLRDGWTSSQGWQLEPAFCLKADNGRDRTG